MEGVCASTVLLILVPVLPTVELELCQACSQHHPIYTSIKWWNYH